MTPRIYFIASIPKYCKVAQICQLVERRRRSDCMSPFLFIGILGLFSLQFAIQIGLLDVIGLVLVCTDLLDNGEK